MNKKPKNIDEYIENYSPEIGAILNQIRSIVKRRVPNAVEKISYQMPCFKNGKNYFYIGAFSKHIGIYPPMRGDNALIAKLKNNMNEKGNLAFPYKDGIPFDVIEEIIVSKLL